MGWARRPANSSYGGVYHSDSVKDESNKIIGSQHELKLWYTRYQRCDKENTWTIEVEKDKDILLNFISGVAGLIVPGRTWTVEDKKHL